VRGTREVTKGVEITPARPEENLARLDAALDDLESRRADGKPGRCAFGDNAMRLGEGGAAVDDPLDEVEIVRREQDRVAGRPSSTSSSGSHCIVRGSRRRSPHRR
jgi:hypothetical protein